MTRDERRFVIDLMTWSFSRLSSFYGCKREWLERYIENPGNNLSSCYAQFGSLCHGILEEYYNGELSLWDIPLVYEDRFNDTITEYFPIRGNKDARQEYFDKGYDYFCNMNELADNYEILGVEKKVEFTVDGYEFVGFIDLLLRDRNTGEITIIDHKSATLKFKKDGTLSKTSLPKFEDYKKQLYLYSIPIVEEYGCCDWLEWNLFKDQTSIVIPWDANECERTKQWAINTIHLIEEEDEWPSKPDYMYCCYLCSKRADCPDKWGRNEIQQLS